MFQRRTVDLFFSIFRFFLLTMTGLARRLLGKSKSTFSILSCHMRRKSFANQIEVSYSIVLLDLFSRRCQRKENE